MRRSVLEMLEEKGREGGTPHKEEVQKDIPELDADLNSPLIKVICLGDAYFTRTTDLAHVVGEGVADFADQVVELRFPFAL